MITTAGKNVIKQYFGGQTGNIGGAIVLGTGTTAASLTDTKLAFEAIRITNITVSADLANSRIVFKATVPPGIIGTVYEMGLYHQGSMTGRSQGFNYVDTTAGPFTWTNATLVTTNARSSTKTVKIDAATSATTTAFVNGVGADFTQFIGTDSVAIAFTADANTSALKLRFGSDASNYYEFNFASPAVGYNTLRLNYSAATTVGSPVLANMQYVALVATAKSSGATSVYFDDVRIEDNTVTDELVARFVLTTPKVMDQSLPSDVEYSLGITV